MNHDATIYEEILWVALIWLTSLSVTLVAVDFSRAVVPARSHMTLPESHDTISAMATWGGWNQREIMQLGDPAAPNDTSHMAVFPPFYPLMAKILTRIGVRDDAALVVVSNISFVMFLVLLESYWRIRAVAK